MQSGVVLAGQEEGDELQIFNRFSTCSTSNSILHNRQSACKYGGEEPSRKRRRTSPHIRRVKFLFL
eukprot:gene7258-8066_t